MISLALTQPGCAGRAVPTPVPASQTIQQTAQPARWDYDVIVGPELDLRIEASFHATVTSGLVVDDTAMRFVDGLEHWENGAFHAVDGATTATLLPCPAPCRVRYRFRLREAATSLASVDVALAAGGALFAPPSTWLLRPNAGDARGTYRFHVSIAAPDRFVTGVRPASDGAADTYEGDVTTLDESAFSAFGALRIHRLAPPDIDVAMAPELGLGDDTVASWLNAELAAIGAYLGRVPDPHLVLFVAPGTSQVNRGKTLGGGGASVLVRLGTGASAAALRDDWVVAHELVHVGFPALGYEHAWFGEGLASYVEPVARARAGLLPEEQLWADLVEGMPQGQPAPGDPGLEGTEEWGRVYWGGALYFLLADLAIREQTAGARALDDAVRAVRAAANVESHWTLERVIATGDRATATHVLRDLYERQGRKAEATDLEALWARLGVRRDGTSVRFDDGALLARYRRAITSDADNR